MLVPANSSAIVYFTVAIPQDIAPGFYPCNLYLVFAAGSGNGTFFDRGVIGLEVK